MRLTKEQIEALDDTTRKPFGIHIRQAPGTDPNLDVMYDHEAVTRALRTQARIDALSDEQRAFLREYAEEERENESSDWMCLQYMDGPSHESCAEAWSAIIAIMGDDK